MHEVLGSPDKATMVKQSLERLFSSEAFYRIADSFCDGKKDAYGARGRLVGYFLEYATLFPDQDPDLMVSDVGRLLPHAEKLGSHNLRVAKSELYLSRAASVLGVSVGEINSRKRELLEYLYNAYKVEGYAYHGFNSAAEANIQQKGLSVEQEDKLWFDADISVVTGIFSKYGVTNQVVGWLKLNCEGNAFLSETSDFTYDYSLSSPEWFSQFTGGFPGFQKYRKDDGHIMAKRDYTAARGVLEGLMADKKFVESDRVAVLHFFEHYWMTFCIDTGPRVALVKKSSLSRYRNKTFNKWYDSSNRPSYGETSEPSASELAQRLFTSIDSEIVLSGPEVAQAEVAAIVELPPL